jgi:peroxiredoxin
MAGSSEPSLNQLFAELHAHRVETMDKDDLQVNIDQRKLLEEEADRSAFVRAGQVVTPFSLPEVHGGVVELDQLLTTGPVVLVFFRFEGCPACNIALPHYQHYLYPALRDLGATLVAISPQIPEKLAAVKDRLNLEFFVATDVDNWLARSFGIVFTSSEASQARARAKGSDLGETLGTGKWELPMPTVVVIDQQRVVRFADVHPDWLSRTEAPIVVEAVRQLLPVSA